MPNANTTLQEWVKTKLEPWKAETQAYQKAYAEHLQRMKDNLPQLENIIGLLLDGRTRSAVLAWNTLNLYPKVQDIKISPDAATITLLPVGGAPMVLKTDILLADLDKLANG